jgi:heptosyltransferase-2
MNRISGVCSTVDRIDPAGVRALVVRTPNWLGDSVMALPALRVLRAAIPHGRITLVGPWADLFRDQGVADRVIVPPQSLPRRLARARTLRALGADTALLLPNSFESALAAWMGGAVRRVGFATGGRTWLLTHPLSLPAPRRHQVHEYLQLLEVFNLRSVETAPTWTQIPSPADQLVSRLLSEVGVAEKVPRVGLHLGAALGPSKLWPVEQWAALAAELVRLGVTPVLLGSAADLPAASKVLERCPTPVPSLVGRDTAALLPRLLSRFTALVSGDTGVAHLAAAMNVGVIALFGPTHPRLTRPLGFRSVAIWKGPPCSPCFLSRCPIDHVCMRSISVEEVLEKVQAQLAWRDP